MVLLVKFERDYFTTGSNFSESFDDILRRAMDGSDYSYSETPADEPGTLAQLLIGFVSLAMSVVPFVFICAIITTFSRAHKLNPSGGAGTFSYHFGEAGNRLPLLKDSDYWREIPCEKDIEIAYWTSLVYAVCHESELKTGVIGAFLLDWLKKGYIEIISLPKKAKPFGKDDNYAIAFLDTPALKSEKDLMTMMTDAKGSIETLNPKQFQKWCDTNYPRVQNWYQSLETAGVNKLTRRGLMARETIPLPDAKILGISIIKNRTKTVNNVDPSLREEAVRLQGLKKFLLEFSVISQRTVYEVKTWEEYLIFAQLLGIADKVREQLRKVYPEFSKISRLDADGSGVGVLIGSFAASGYNGMRNGAARASSSSSGGGGGHSSGGGGGGSRGGGSGGGFR
jgi:hypothetical protein